MNNFYCPLPFKHIFVAPNGVKSCCSYTGSYEGTIEQYLESNLLAHIQSSILKGIIPSGCRECQQSEKQTNHSTRLIALDDYNNTHYTNTDIDYVDLRSSNLCNLKCRSCNPLFSSRIQSELNKNFNDLAEFYSYQNKSTLIQVNDSDVNYIKNHLYKINRLNLTGGEPTFIPEVKTILDECEKQEFNGNILITSNVNFTDKFWFELSKKLGEQIHWTISIDAIGDGVEIIRSGSSWELMDYNINKLVQVSNSIEFNITVSALNIQYILELLLYINDIKNKYRHIPNGKTIRLSPCWDPDFLQIQIIPENIIKNIIDEMEYLLAHENLHIDIFDSFNELLNILSNNNENKILWKKFLIYNNTLNRIRDEDFNINE